MLLSDDFRRRMILDTTRLVEWQIDLLGGDDPEKGLLVYEVNSLLARALELLNQPASQYELACRQERYHKLLTRVQSLVDEAELINYVYIVMITRRNAR